MLLQSGGICGLLVLGLMPIHSTADEDEARATKSCLIEDNTNYRGHDVEGFKVDGVKSCAERCLKDDRCLFWTLVNSNNRCYLKSSNANKVVQKGETSGNKLCGKTGSIVNGGWSDWSEWGTCFCGNTIGTTKIQIRTRTCSKPEKTIGGKDCSGPSQDTRDCNLGSCPACYFIPLGCWKDKADLAIPSLEGSEGLTDTYKQRFRSADEAWIFSPIDDCFMVALSKGLTAFAIQDHGKCMGGPNAMENYKKYGKAEAENKCWLGMGGGRYNNVYKITCDDVKVIKKDYLALKNDGSKKYRDSVRYMLPVLLKNGAIQENEIGISYELMIPEKSNTWPLLTGDDIITTRLAEQSITINGTVTKKIGQRKYIRAYHRTTGLYAEAGKIVTVKIPQQLVGKISVMIGQSKWEALGHTFKYKMEKSIQAVASPWGGLISILLDDIDATTKQGQFDVVIKNSVQAPYFVYGKNSNAEWNTFIKKQAAPWALFVVPGQVQIRDETEKVKSVTDIEKVMKGWKNSFDIADDLLGLPVGSKPGEEQIHMDPGGSCWREGSCNEGGGSSFCGWGEGAKFSDDSGGIYHEMGHGYCFPDLPSASSQMWAELIREYIERTKGNIPMSKKPGDDTFYLLFRMVSYSKYSKGKSCGRESLSKDGKRSYKTGAYINCWYFVYRLPLYEFGWNVFKKMMNLDAIATKSYKSREERLVDLYCKATGRNLIPMFHFYNIRVSESIEEACKKQQLPDLITKYLSIATCLLDDTKDDKECSKLPGFPPHNGLCTLTGVCSTNRDLNRRVIMNNEFDLWGSISANTGDFNRKEDYQQYKNTSMIEDNCLKRASEMFDWCGNSEIAQNITANFASKDGTSKSSVAGPPQGNCYHDSPRLLPHHKKSSQDMTPDICNVECYDFKYYGVEYGKECWCGNDAPPRNAKRRMSNCNKPCKGDITKFCGGNYMINIDATKIPKGNCFSDSPRQLTQHKKSSSDMTPDMCKKECSDSGYNYYGVQYAEECWCGEQAPSKKQKREMSECDMPCKGDRSQFCGGSYRMNIYQL